jgi:hypothetical protein
MKDRQDVDSIVQRNVVDQMIRESPDTPCPHLCKRAHAEVFSASRAGDARKILQCPLHGINKSLGNGGTAISKKRGLFENVIIDSAAASKLAHFFSLSSWSCSTLASGRLCAT